MTILSLSLVTTAALVLHPTYSTPALTNLVAQLLVFTPTALVPALVTGRMSWVDIAWPWGLVTIGLVPLLCPPEAAWSLRSVLVMAAFFAAGGRMALGGLVALRQGRFDEEFQRYKYQRIEWAKSGLTDESSLRFKLVMQKEILVQAVANMGPLCLPLMLQVYGPASAQALTTTELLGWVIWAASLVWEHTADKQKKAFIKDCQKNGLKGQVCEVGLWRWCRHPNYFGEWMVWNSLILVTLPSTLSSLSSGLDLVILAGLLSISYIMYLCLVHYTGAVPAEFYSIKSRPGYKSYQQRVNMFIPGPRRQE